MLERVPSLRSMFAGKSTKALCASVSSLQSDDDTLPAWWIAVHPDEAVYKFWNKFFEHVESM